MTPTYQQLKDLKEMYEPLTLQGRFLFEFSSHSKWVNKAQSWFAPYRYGYSYVCLDKNNNVCYIGEDFRIADENDLFPIKVYALKRTKDANY